MRRITWILLLFFAFTVPWQYSLDFGEPFGNIARCAGLLVVPFALASALQSRGIRPPGILQYAVAAFLIYLCCTSLWTLDLSDTTDRLRGYFQEMLIVWLIWEFADSAAQLRALLRAWVAGSSILAILTLVTLFSPQTSGQFRFVPAGQNANDVARFLALAIPLAAVLFISESRWQWRLLSAVYLPLGFAAVLFTASRSGFILCLVAFSGSGVLLVRKHPGLASIGAAVILGVGAEVARVAPIDTLRRLGTIPDQILNGGLNQRFDIWISGWQAFARAPFFGTGAGTFIAATGLPPGDTAHNTALSIAIEGGVCALALATTIVAIAIRCVRNTCEPVRIALATVLLTWLAASFTATVEETRTTWLLLALVALAARLSAEYPDDLKRCFDCERSVVPALSLEVQC